MPQQLSQLGELVATLVGGEGTRVVLSVQRSTAWSEGKFRVGKGAPGTKLRVPVLSEPTSEGNIRPAWKRM